MKIEVTYKRVRRLSMRIVKNGDVHVTAPIGISPKEVERFIADNKEWMESASERTLNRQLQRERFYARLPLKTPLQRAEALGRMKAMIPPIIEKYATLMGVRPKSVTYAATISRWGVCYPSQQKVSFSLYLLLLPDWCVEHVVVHELAHLLEPSHNARFHSLMDQYFPRWRQARRETKKLML